MKPVVRIALIAVAAVSAVALAVVVRGAVSGKPTSQAAAAVPITPQRPMARVLVAKRDLKLGDRIAADDLDWQDWPLEAVNVAYVTDGSTPMPEAPPPTIEEQCKAEVAEIQAKPGAKKTKAHEDNLTTQCVDRMNKEAKDAKDPKKAAKKGEAKKTDIAASGAVAQVTRTVANLADGGPKAQFLGAVVREPILKGEPIVERKLVHAGQSGYLAVVLSPGMRAMAVSVKVETAAGGFILPGDRVDVILSREMRDEGKTGFMSATVLNNIKVLAIDQVTQPDKGETTVVGATATLELDARSAEVLALAKAQGDLSLTLRSYADAADPSGAVNIKFAPAAQARAQASAQGSTVRVFRNGEASDVSVNP